MTAVNPGASRQVVVEAALVLLEPGSLRDMGAGNAVSGGDEEACAGCVPGMVRRCFSPRVMSPASPG